MLYFDIFSYPLKAEEIWDCLDHELPSREELKASLDALVKAKRLYVKDGFYMARPEPSWVERRVKGNTLAEKRLEKARKVSRFVAKFPFVEAVMLSGSLSKGYMEEDSDIDYFIVTQPGRLWVARTSLILYKKLFLFNSHKNFCVNYFVDTDHLQIEDKNLFTATEVVYLLPTVSPKTYKDFRAINQWVEQWYPQFPSQDLEHCQEKPKSLRKRFAEWILGGWLGERVDAWFMRSTLKRWQKKFGGMDPERFEITLRSRRYVSKHHPSDFQQRVLSRIHKGMQEYEDKHQVSLGELRWAE